MLFMDRQVASKDEHYLVIIKAIMLNTKQLLSVNIFSVEGYSAGVCVTWNFCNKGKMNAYLYREDKTLGLGARQISASKFVQ